MKTAKLLAVACGVTLGLFLASTQEADAGQFRRQYYSSWNYNTTSHYHYRTYHYKPTPTYTGYRSHYCIYHYQRPRYIKYYNRYDRHYWGRFDCQGKPGANYSLLAEKDRKPLLSQIPESAFPKPGALPPIPESKDGEGIAAPPTNDLPTGPPPGVTPPAAPGGTPPAPPGGNTPPAPPGV